MDLARGNNDKGGKVPAQVQQGAHFHGPLRLAELCPRKQRQAQIDGRGIQGIGDAFQIGTKGLARIEPGCLGDQDVGEVGEHPPVPLFVGLGQRASGDGMPDARVIEL